jgi:hypothetical protein
MPAPDGVKAMFVLLLDGVGVTQPLGDPDATDRLLTTPSPLPFTSPPSSGEEGSICRISSVVSPVIASFVYTSDAMGSERELPDFIKMVDA